jgi:hypothetical protein
MTSRCSNSHSVLLMRAKTLPRAPEKNLPLAIEASEDPVKLVPGELSPGRLKAFRRPNRAVFVNTTVDVGRTALKRGLAQYNLALNGELHKSSLASSTG